MIAAEARSFELWLSVIAIVPPGTNVPDSLWTLGTSIVNAIGAQFALAKGQTKGLERYIAARADQDDRGRCNVIKAISRVVRPKQTTRPPAAAASIFTDSRDRENRGRDRDRDRDRATPRSRNNGSNRQNGGVGGAQPPQNNSICSKL